MRALELELLGVPVRLVTDADELLARLEMCYARLLRTRAVPATELTLAGSLERDGDGYRVTVDGRAPCLERDPIQALRTLNHEVLQALMQRCRDHYFVHAAVVEHGGSAIVLPGLSRAGKSTLALALLLEGARYLSDELLCLTSDGDAVPLPRALKLRDECVVYFPELAGVCVGEGEGRFVPFDALSPEVLALPSPVGTIAVPRWSPEASDRPEPLSRGKGLLAVAKSSLNFGTHRERSLIWLTTVSERARVYALDWNDPRAAARALLAELHR